MARSVKVAGGTTCSQISVLNTPSPAFCFDYPPDLIAGIDEAGRGCLAGPVVAAAVILPKNAHIDGLNDSKQVPESHRGGMAAEIAMIAVAWSLGVVWPKEIDKINILESTFKAMARAVATLKKKPAILLVDGDKPIPSAWLRKEAKRDYTQQNIVDGDAKIPVISAASIMAKVFRDNLMEHLDKRYPGYNFAKHKGYGTEEHIEAIKRLGPCPLHRMTFAKVCPEPTTHSTNTRQVQQGLLSL